MNRHPESLLSQLKQGFIIPDWPAPENVQALSTTRQGGVSEANWRGLNLGTHVDDDPEHVNTNRELLQQAAGLSIEPFWLNQVHSNTVADASCDGVPDADASTATSAGSVCVVMTADCLPLLMCDTDGTTVAAVHAGWRGLESGVIENALTHFRGKEVLVWLGPAISAAAYEVDDALRERFLALDDMFSEAFTEGRPGHWQFDLYAAARSILRSNGVANIYGGNFCTFEDQRFYSHRRDGSAGTHTGRQASLIRLMAD